MSPATLGVLEWFRPGERERVERVLGDLRALGVRHLRTGVSWADYYTPEGRAWYDWLIPRLASEVEIVPCFLYTPPSLGVEPRTSSPPRDPKAYADFLDVMITNHGDHFDYMELWNEPNNRAEWDYTLDPEWDVFTKMIGGAAYWAKHRGKKTILGGMSPFDPHWLRLMFDRGVMRYIDVVGVHGFPGTWEVAWNGWESNLNRVRDVLREHGSKADVWITEAGFSTWNHDERQQVFRLLDVAQQQVGRVYWYSIDDLNPDRSALVGFHIDEREYHFGLRRADGTPKLLHRVWSEGGIENVKRHHWLTEPATFAPGSERPVLITGGAGFVGTNLAHRILQQGRPVLLLDNLSRPGALQNLRWLREHHGDRVQVEVADLRNTLAVRHAVERASEIYHLAAQVAVTTSLTGPVDDFEVNARGTLNLLEAMRALKEPPGLVFTSTNKVYGAMDDVRYTANGTRYIPEDKTVRASGFAETRPLDFHSPYGCSKGAADQYVLDYARTYDLPATVFRMSCIYGPHQHGNEDQGWLAHFVISSIKGEPVTVYGDGRQVRDALYVDDLVDAFLAAQREMPVVRGRAFNIGGGPGNTLSILELLDHIERLHGHKPGTTFDAWRPGDQRYYVSDTTAFRRATGWAPTVPVAEGVKRLYQWVLDGQKRAAQIPA